MFLTIPEVARELKVHENTVRNLIKKGDLSAVRIGRQWRIKDTDLQNVCIKEDKASALMNAGFSADETAKILEFYNTKLKPASLEAAK